MSEIDTVKNFIFNDEVQKILSKINDSVMDFNILEITGMGTQEIKHSNVLSWLFDDREHNLGYQILDNFLKKVIDKNINNKNDFEDLQAYLYLADKKRDISVYREKDNIDLLIVDESNKIIIAIENKVYASERVDGEDGGQLEKYEGILEEKYKNYKKYFVFLTITLEEASQENWLKADYQMIVDVIEDLLKTKEVSQKTKIILESYVDLLKRNGIVEDNELKELCEKIWLNKKYVNALDILMDYRVSCIKKVYEELRNKIDFYEDTSYVKLESIKEIYDLDGKQWDSSDEIIFEVVCEYNKGKNEYIWLGFWHPDLSKGKEKTQNICKKIKNRTTDKSETILSIYKKDIENKDVETVVEEVVNKIKEIEERIEKVVNEET